MGALVFLPLFRQETDLLAPPAWMSKVTKTLPYTLRLVTVILVPHWGGWGELVTKGTQPTIPARALKSLLSFLLLFYQKTQFPMLETRTFSL